VVRLVEKEWNDEEIFKGMRVGLSNKYPEYLNRQYRYLIRKKEIKKQKKDLISIK